MLAFVGFERTTKMAVNQVLRVFSDREKPYSFLASHHMQTTVSVILVSSAYLHLVRPLDVLRVFLGPLGHATCLFRVVASNFTLTFIMNAFNIVAIFRFVVIA